MLYSLLSLRKWRNWQTRKPQELVGFGSWGFKSPLPHQTTVHGSAIVVTELPAAVEGGDHEDGFVAVDAVPACRLLVVRALVGGAAQEGSPRGTLPPMLRTTLGVQLPKGFTGLPD